MSNGGQLNDYEMKIFKRQSGQRIEQEPFKGIFGRFDEAFEPGVYELSIKPKDNRIPSAEALVDTNSDKIYIKIVFRDIIKVTWLIPCEPPFDIEYSKTPIFE